MLTIISNIVDKKLTIEYINVDKKLTNKVMSLRKSISYYLSQHKSATSSELASHFGVTRQALNRHLRVLISSGEVIKTGSTRNARYHAPKHAPKAETITRQVRLANADESDVYQNIAITLGIKRAIANNIEEIFHYAFTEVLNNAIDHSQADSAQINVSLGMSTLSFSIRDRGIGVFASIADKFSLPSEQDAMIELIKGKTTTMPSRHTGEGLFFTSKIADRFVLRSHHIQLEWNRLMDDVFLTEARYLKGTKASFEIDRNATRQLAGVFERYAPEEFDYQFQKTEVTIKLVNSTYISRSEAKRIVHGLEKFRHVTLDFKDVKTLGQGFADEVFRVFIDRHPGVEIVSTNATKTVAAMIKHAGGAVE